MSNFAAGAAGAGSALKDLKSGFLVFLIALPLCLGIAMASGFPPVAGVLTAIIGGVVVSFLGSARLTIKGPAAGLIVIAIGAVTELGQGDMSLGYKRALAVGVVAAVLQILFALLRAASVGVAMSPSVVHGMLAAIGVIIISKQSHIMLGVKPEAKEPLPLLAELPKSILHANPEIVLIGLLSLLILFGVPRLKHRWARVVPAPLWVLLVTVPLGLLFGLDQSHDYRLWTNTYHLGPEFLVNLPGSLLDAIAFPDFSAILSGTSIKYIIMFALVGTIESTLSVLAVDSIDPEKRASNLNRDLLALGVGNLTSSLVGGLPMISEIVRSKANVDAGATSARANFFHGVFLLLFVALAPGLLHMIPLAALAAMLVYTGFRLASPNEFVHARKLGRDQLFLFLVTIFVTLATDLLIGVGVGLVLKIILHRYRGVPLPIMIRPQPEVAREGDTLIIFPKAAIFSALLPLRKALTRLDDEVREVIIDLKHARLVDHTFLSRLEAMALEWPRAKLTLRGMEQLVPVASHPHSTRVRRRRRAA